MEKKRFGPLLTVLVLMLIAAAANSRVGDPQLTSHAGVRRQLPGSVGEFTGRQLFYCSNASCAEAYGADDFDDAPSAKCPLCDSELDTMAPVERRLLPAGTEVLRSFYRDTGNNSFFVSVVIGGRDRLSLHRPENCLPGQGLSIRSRSILQTALRNGETLQTRLLDVRRRLGESDVDVFSHFAYWYVAPQRETHSQWQLYTWIASDRLLHARMDRWSYIAVARDFNPAQEEKSLEKLRGFLAELHPLIVVPHTE